MASDMDPYQDDDYLIFEGNEPTIPPIRDDYKPDWNYDPEATLGPPTIVPEVEFRP
ncbi:MAG: hypothetical protein GVY30_05455, partial [Chloroflexi bacterium]|nr:hypothetical protein [Chloroflexota bacterium]